MGLLLTFLVQLIIGDISLQYTTYTKYHLNHIHIFFNNQTFVSASLAGMTKTFPSVSSPCRKKVLISMAFIFYFFCAINASIILRASLEQVGGSFNISSLYISSCYLSDLSHVFKRTKPFKWSRFLSCIWYFCVDIFLFPVY